ncbi:aminotransferase class I/II-fold pyridoxal phosphate-dependent enzyme [Micromonospora sp. CPCC 205539]
MDVRLAPAIAAALHAAVDDSDTGYAGDASELVAHFCEFAQRRWRWHVEPAAVRTCADIAVGVTEVLRRLVSPGDGVVVMPPVYPPYFAWLREVGAHAVEVPLVELEVGGRLDLEGIERALAAGARVVLLCHPHNPTGRVHESGELQALAEAAARYGATVLSDEIHGPLTHQGHHFHPYLSCGDAALATGIAFTSASKAWNLAGLKCALIVASDPRHSQVIDRLPHELPWGVGHLGMLAATAAFEHGEIWLDQLVDALAANAVLLRDQLAQQLPEVTFPMPQASYLAWLNCSPLRLGSDPAQAFLQHGRVALSSGHDFGARGSGHARFNFACSPDLIREAVSRMAHTALLRR